MSIPPRIKHVEFIERVLRPKIAGQALDDDLAHLFPYADLYSATPDELAADHPPGPRNEWYFLSHARYIGAAGTKLLRKHSNGGWWRPYTRVEVRGDDGLLAGYLKRFSYRMNTVKTEWTMIEYSLPQDQQPQDDHGQRLVLCTMYNRRIRPPTRVRADV